MTDYVYVKRSAALAKRFDHDALAGAGTDHYHMSPYLHTKKDIFDMHDYRAKRLDTGHESAP